MFGKNINWIKTYIVEVLPFLSVAFFSLSYIYYSAFYSVFGIDILQYATFGDIFLGITEHLVSLGLLSILVTEYFLSLFYNPNNKIESEKISKKDVKKFTVVFFICYFFSILFILVLETNYKDFFEGYIDFNKFWFPIFLIFPLFISSIYILIQVLNKKAKVVKFFFTNGIFKLLILILTYYSYLMCMFSDLGVVDGLKRRDRDNIKFEIRTVGGCVYNNNNYRYISHLSGNTFLYNKKSKENVILYNDNIEYTKMKDSDFQLNIILIGNKQLKNK